MRVSATKTMKAIKAVGENAISKAQVKASSSSGGVKFER
jgi:hypothetical protein